MSIESIPEEQSKDSSIINLPSLEIGRDVENGDDNIDEEEEVLNSETIEEAKDIRIRGKNMKKFYELTKKGKDFTDNDWENEDIDDPEKEEITYNIREDLNNIYKIKDKEKRVEEINNYISEVIEEYENSKKTNKDFCTIINKLDIFSFYPGVNDSWNQKQVDKIIEIYEENEKNYKELKNFDLFGSVLHEGDIVHLVADKFIRRMESGEKISKAFLDQIRYWAGENADLTDFNEAFELLFELINNSDKIDRSDMEGIVSDLLMSDHLEGFVRNLSSNLDKNKHDNYKSLKLIEVLNYFKNLIDEQYFEECTVEYNLNKYKKDNNNYFVNFKIDQVLDFFHKTKSTEEKRFYLNAIKNYYNDFVEEMPDMSTMNDEEIKDLFEQFKYDINTYQTEIENKRRKNIYEDTDIRNSYDIKPAIFEYKEYSNKEEEKEFCFSKINDKYGIIYTPEGLVDSFFELDKENAEKDDNKKNKPKRLDIDDILEKEGFKKENMSDEEYKKMVLTYKTLIELPMREKIENEFDIELNSFNIREQVQFVNFLSSKSVKEVEEVKKFLNQGQDVEVKNNRIKAFLSLELGEKMGEKILNIGEKLEDSKNADAIFAKYVEIISLTEKSKEELENLFKNRKDISDEEIEKVTQNLISKAGQILIDFSDKIGKGEKTDKGDILNELEKYKADLILTASVYKGINKENVNFEDLEEVELEKKNANDLSDEEIEQMKDIYARNYKYNPEFQKAILDNFDNILKESENKTEIYFYKDNDKIVAFSRFDVIDEGKKYFGSFNVDPVLNSSSIGSSLMEASLEKESVNNEIEADCIPETLISSKYIGGGCGFVVKKINTDYKNTGVALFNIEKRKENKKYHYFNCSEKEIIEEYNSKNSDNQYDSYPERFILRFEPKSKELISTTEKLIKENYVISNYVFSKNCKEVYCAFEKE